MVDWKAIGDICYISDYVSNGSFASLRENVQYKSEPDYAVLIRFADYSNGFDESKFVYVDEHAYNFLSKSELRSGDIIMSNVGSCGLYFTCPNLNKKMSLAPNSILIRSEFNRYLNHWFGTYQGMEDIKKITSKSAMPKFNKTEFKKIQIPIPSKSEINKIVEQLDTFTSSIEILKEQIALRRKQYDYYRDQLLDLEGKEGVEMKRIGDFCDTLSGFPFDSSQFKDDGIQLMRGANIKRGYFDFSQELNKYWISSDGLEKYLLAANDIIISMDGSLVGKSFCYLKSNHLPLLLVQRVARIRTKENFKYVYYNISKSFPEYVDKKKTAGAIPHISMKDINGFIIPVPSLSEQNRIVNILNKFEASIQNLEAQLSLREKQYEYYRNKLLTFE